ncbi:MAG TPA: response regulator transcription factor [Clostridiales bacterium]|nr:response regulator transcription factor [Clostridiales bacterium]
MSVLIVEDDKTIALGMEYALKQEGYQVTVCYNAAEAKEKINKGSFDLAVLDVALPDGDGYELCRLIRGKSDMPVIFVTAMDEEVNVVMGLDIGADDYITKPFRVRELLSRIRSVLRRYNKSAESGNEIILKNIRINTAEAKVYKNGEQIFLTSLEYKLLLTLARSEGNILTRNQILEGIWDAAGEFVNDNTLTVYIKRLREKIEDDPQNPQIIQTVRGFGYRIGG